MTLASVMNDMRTVGMTLRRVVRVTTQSLIVETETVETPAPPPVVVDRIMYKAADD